MKALVVEDLFDVSNDVQNMLVNSSDLLSKMARFLANRQCDERAKDDLSFAASQLYENPNYKWERFEELYGLVENNSNALIQNCTTPDPVYGVNNSEPAFESADAFWHGMQANLSK